MKKYMPYVKKYLYCFILGPLFMVIEACGEFILPFLNADIIDNGAAVGDIDYIFRKALFMLLIAAIMLTSGVLGTKFAITGAANMSAEVRRDTFEKIQGFSFTEIDYFSTGSLITRITNDITQIQSFAQTLLRGFFRSPIMIIGALVMSFVLEPRLAWIIFIVIPILAFITFMIIKTASPRYTAMQEQLDKLNTNIGESITNERVIKSFVREDYEINKFDSVSNSLMKKSVRALKVMVLMQPVSALAVNVTTLAVVWFAGRRIIVGEMEVGTLTAFVTYLSQVLTALNFLANMFLKGTRAAASDKRISEVLNTEAVINDEHAKHKDYVVSKGEIEFRNVCFKYFKESEEKILDSINVHIGAGELVGIVGSTGSGKTTLISMIPRLYDPDEGEVLVDNINVKELSLFNLRESVAVVLQKNTLFAGTIAENLRWGNENASDEEIKAAAKLAQADEFVSSFTEGYETELGQGGVNLSGGQKQRLCIARALLKKPKILILDDSTSAVDTATDARIRRAFREKLSGITKIIIAQRISSVEDADKIIVMDGGRIVGCGKHGELIRSCRTYQEIYYSQKDKEVENNE